MANRTALTGNDAVAACMRQINPDVVAAYPITPSTDIVQSFAQFVADGLVKTNLVTVESEHSAMSATIGASQAGARSMTATSSQGLALMWEMLYIAASLRLPIVMPVVNRALSGPINIHCDHSDSMGARDSGWIQIYCENAQEVYDNLLQAVRIAEHPDVLLPVMVCQDGFITSHALENLFTEDDEFVRQWVGEYKPDRYLLDVDKPMTIGALDLQDFYFEHKRSQAEAMRNAPAVIAKVAEEFGAKTGRKYGFFEEYKLDDAEIAIVVLNSTAGTARPAVDALRKDGIKAGFLKPRVFRPFPHEMIAQALKHVKVIAVMDRADGFNGIGGPMFFEIRSSLYDLPKRPVVLNYVYGLGGRDVTTNDIKAVYNDLAQVAKTGKHDTLASYLGVRE